MFKTIISFLLKNLGPAGQILSVLFSDVLRKELQVVLPIAAKAVQMVENDTSILTTKDKFLSASKLIGNELLSAQKSIGDSTINLAIEIAVKALKGK